MFYTKYRPAKIADLDNEQVRETLGKSLLSDKWSSAYLLTGPRGIGKTTTARLIAKIINCQKRKPGEEPCGECEACVSITSGVALDVVEIDAASNRGIDEIRSLREQVKLLPSSLKFKVYIIDEVHMLTTEAFNALLKTLEEPPAHVVFVLATTDLNKVPQTIISRCVHFQFNLSTIAETVRSLKRVVSGEGLQVEDVVLEKIAQLAKGSFRDATKILEQVANLSSSITLEELSKVTSTVSIDKSFELVKLIAEKKHSEALSWLENFVNLGGNPRELNSSLIKILRDVLVSRLGIKTEVEDLPQFSNAQIEGIINDLIVANGQFSLTPVSQLPIELVVAKWGSETVVKKVVVSALKEPVKEKDPSPVVPDNPVKAEPVVVKEVFVGEPGDLLTRWEDVLATIKNTNLSINAFLKAARPVGVDEEFATIEVFYKFHKEKLEEAKNRDVVEKAISAIIGKDLKVKFILGEKVKS